mgnify:CR=1 FL=1
MDTCIFTCHSAYREPIVVGGVLHVRLERDAVSAVAAHPRLELVRGRLRRRGVAAEEARRELAAAAAVFTRLGQAREQQHARRRRGADGRDERGPPAEDEPTPASSSDIQPKKRRVPGTSRPSRRPRCSPTPAPMPAVSAPATECGPPTSGLSPRPNTFGEPFR